MNAGAPRPGAGLRVFSGLTTLGLFLVIVMGLLVTQTDSAQGCGRHWPLCHGQLIPTFNFHTLVEFSHRGMAGFVGLMIGALAIWAWVVLGRSAIVRGLAIIAVLFVIVQSLLGAAAVLWPESPSVLALHLGISLIDFGAVVLLTAQIWQDPSPQAASRRSIAIPPRLRATVWVIMAYLLGVIYLGAYVAHSNAGLACGGWPLCNGQLIPALHGLVLIAFAHRVAAVLALGLYVWMFLQARRVRERRPDLYQGAHWALAFVVLQAGSGAVLIWTRIAVFAVVLHGALVSCLFGATSYLCLQVIASAVPWPAENPPGLVHPG